MMELSEACVFMPRADRYFLGQGFTAKPLAVAREKVRGLKKVKLCKCEENNTKEASNGEKGVH